LDLSGKWHSKYEYYSTSRREQLTCEHEMLAIVDDNHLILETVPGSESYVFMRLSLEGATATGSWYETTNPDGYYHGATYHGAVQLIRNHDSTKLKGKWIGFGRHFDIKDGPWELVKIDN
jgi:hypothetical protein